MAKSPKRRPADRIPGNRAAARYGRSGLFLLVVSGALALAGAAMDRTTPRGASLLLSPRWSGSAAC